MKLLTYLFLAVFIVVGLAMLTAGSERVSSPGAKGVGWAGNGLDNDSLMTTEKDTSDVFYVGNADYVGVVVGGASAVNSADSLQLHIDRSWDNSTWEAAITAELLTVTSTFGWVWKKWLEFPSVTNGAVATADTIPQNLASYIRIRLENDSAEDTVSSVKLYVITK